MFGYPTEVWHNILEEVGKYHIELFKSIDMDQRLGPYLHIGESRIGRKETQEQLQKVPSAGKWYLVEAKFE